MKNFKLWKKLVCCVLTITLVIPATFAKIGFSQNNIAYAGPKKNGGILDDAYNWNTAKKDVKKANEDWNNWMKDLTGEAQKKMKEKMKKDGMGYQEARFRMKSLREQINQSFLTNQNKNELVIYDSKDFDKLDQSFRNENAIEHMKQVKQAQEKMQQLEKEKYSQFKDKESQNAFDIVYNSPIEYKDMTDEQKKAYDSAKETLKQKAEEVDAKNEWRREQGTYLALGLIAVGAEIAKDNINTDTKEGQLGVSIIDLVGETAMSLTMPWGIAYVPELLYNFGKSVFSIFKSKDVEVQKEYVESETTLADITNKLETMKQTQEAYFNNSTNKMSNVEYLLSQGGFRSQLDDVETSSMNLVNHFLINSDWKEEVEFKNFKYNSNDDTKEFLEKKEEWADRLINYGQQAFGKRAIDSPSVNPLYDSFTKICAYITNKNGDENPFQAYLNNAITKNENAGLSNVIWQDYVDFEDSVRNNLASSMVYLEMVYNQIIRAYEMKEEVRLMRGEKEAENYADRYTTKLKNLEIAINNLNTDYVKATNKILDITNDGLDKVYNTKIIVGDKMRSYASFGDAWLAVNSEPEFLNNDVEIVTTKDIDFTSDSIENTKGDFFATKKYSFNDKAFGYLPNGQQYTSKSGSNHFLVALPGSGTLTINLAGHRLAKVDNLTTPTLQIDRRNVDLVSEVINADDDDSQSTQKKETSKSCTFGKINSVSIFNNNRSIEKTLNIKNIEFDGKLSKTNGVNCRTQYGLNIDNCYFTGYEYASPVYVGSPIDEDTVDQYTNKTTIQNTKFVSNKANTSSQKNDGGAILAQDFVANFNIKYCTFNSNTALNDAGAIRLWNADGNWSRNKYDTQGYLTQTNIVGCTFDGNEACNGYGGAMRMNNIYVAMADCRFLNNKSKQSGGAIRIDEPQRVQRNFPMCGLSFDTTDVGKQDYDARANHFGIDLTWGQIKWRDTNIKNNETLFRGNSSSSGEGGAIDVCEDRLPFFAGKLTFSDNKAAIHGGAINLNCGGDFHTYICVEENSYLYARKNYVSNHEENIRIKDAGSSRVGCSYIMLTGPIDNNSEFGIWTDYKRHKVIRCKKGNSMPHDSWIATKLHNDNPGQKGWFENHGDYIKYWYD